MPINPKKPTATQNFLDHQAKGSGRHEKDLNLWHSWNSNGRAPEHLEPLMTQFNPLVKKKVREWTPPSIPSSVMDAEINKHLISAFESYDPAKASLNTHVNYRIQKALRFMGQYQNMAYIPEGKSRHIGEVQKAENQLSQDLGRVPTPDELSTHLGMPVRQVSAIQKSIRRDIAGSSFESDPNPHSNPREQEVLDLLPATLTPEENAVFDHIYGRNGKRKIESTRDLAKQLGKSDSQVSRIKSQIITKFKSYL